jgi:methanethiol oxidase
VGFVDIQGKEGPMPEATDPTFYRSPAAAIAAPPEALAYVAAFDPAGVERDAMTVIDCAPDSPSYGEVVGWTDLPTAGNELHHFGWNACSSALCHEGHAHNGATMRRASWWRTRGDRRS